MTLESSHVKGATTPPLYEDTIGQALKQAAKQWPDREALVSVHQNIRWTFEELDRRATVELDPNLAFDDVDRLGRPVGVSDHPGIACIHTGDDCQAAPLGPVEDRAPGFRVTCKDAAPGERVGLQLNVDVRSLY